MLKSVINNLYLRNYKKGLLSDTFIGTTHGLTDLHIGYSSVGYMVVLRNCELYRLALAY